MKERGVLSTQKEIFTYSRSKQSANRRAACGSVNCDAGQSCDEVIPVVCLAKKKFNLARHKSFHSLALLREAPGPSRTVSCKYVSVFYFTFNAVNLRTTCCSSGTAFKAAFFQVS